MTDWRKKEPTYTDKRESAQPEPMKTNAHPSPRNAVRQSASPHANLRRAEDLTQQEVAQALDNGETLSVQFCTDPSCTICTAPDWPVADDHVSRRAIVAEIRELREFGNEHPEHVLEVYCRINELLDQLGDDS